MQIDYDIIQEVLLYSAGFLAVFFFLYHRYILSLFDPLFTYIYITGFSSVLIISIVNEPKYVIHYFVCQFFLFLGFLTVQKLPIVPTSAKVTFNFYNRDLLEVTVYALFILYVVTNLFVIYSRGTALFSSDPTAREKIFEEGFGTFRRINGGAGSFICAGLTILYLTKPSRIFLAFLAVLTFFTALEGTKSSLLRIVVIVAALVYHPYFRQNKVITDNVKKYAPMGVLLVGSLFIYILTKESNNDAFLAVVTRLVAGADGLLYLYAPQNEYILTNYHPIDYISFILNPIIGFFHIVPYTEPFGSIIVANTYASEFKSLVYLAPNTPFFIEGQIFFGYSGAFIYSFFIGAIFSAIRRFFLTLSQASYFALALASTFILHSGNILIEATYFVKTCFDTCLFAMPVYVFVCFAFNQKVVFRRLKFNA